MKHSINRSNFPLDDDENPFIPCNIDEIAKKVRIVEIREVSNHYDE